MGNIRNRGLKMIYRYQIDVKIKEGTIEFIRNTKALYKEKGIDLEVLEWGIQEFELVRAK